MTQWTGDYDYDLQGNLAQSVRGTETTVNSYDVRNQLTEVAITDAGVTKSAAYRYDDNGLMVRRTVTAGGQSDAELHIRDNQSPYGYSRVLEKRTDAGVLLASFVHGHQPVLKVTPTGTVLHLGDAHSGTRNLIEQPSGLITEIDYDGFGNQLAEQVLPTDQLYRGEPIDSVTGNVYLRARHYSPFTASFFQQDPFAGTTGNPISQHRYQYADRDPLQKGDPTGMWSISVSLGTIAIAGGQMSKANHDVDQGDRIVGIHLANLIVQSTILNFVFTAIEEPLLVKHLPKAGKYWTKTLQPRLYRSASQLDLSKRRLKIVVRIMAGQYTQQLRAQQLNVPMKLTGFPNFSKLMYSNLFVGIKKRDSAVFIPLRGSRSRDFTASNSIMRTKLSGRYLSQPALYTWHHHEVVGVMTLVKTGIGSKSVGGSIMDVGHNLLRHGGGVVYWSLIYNRTYK